MTVIFSNRAGESFIVCRFTSASEVSASEIVRGLRPLVDRDELPYDDVLKVQVVNATREQAQFLRDVLGELVIYGDSEEHSVVLDLNYETLALSIAGHPPHLSGCGPLFEVYRRSDESSYEVGAMLMK